MASTTMPNEIAAKADEYADAGVSVLPIKTDGTKTPKGDRLPIEIEDGEKRASWKPYQRKIAGASERRRLFRSPPVGIGVICGAVSGNLEFIDFDKADLFTPFAAEVELARPGMMSRLTTHRTPEGYHLGYRCDEIEGNQVLAQYPEENEAGVLKAKVAIETRGEGGYVVAPGSPPECHRTGRTYQHLGGPPITKATTITVEERALLFKVARSLTQWFDDEPIESKRAKSKGDEHQGEHSGLMPGHDFAQKMSWAEILEPHGWREHHTSGGRGFWVRPGKEEREGWSATTGSKSANGNELFCVFSTNAHPFQVPTGKPCGCYGKFGAYALLNHDGDFAAAAKALYAEGYGDRVKAADRGCNVSHEPNTWEPSGRTDAANGRRLVLKHGQDIRWCDPWGKWMSWDGQRWATDTACQVEALAKAVGKDLFRDVARAVGKVDEKLLQELTRFARASCNVRGWQNMMVAARSEIGIAVQPDTFDADPWLLNVSNGTIDLRTACFGRTIGPTCSRSWPRGISPRGRMHPL